MEKSSNQQAAISQPPETPASPHTSPAPAPVAIAGGEHHHEHDLDDDEAGDEHNDNEATAVAEFLEVDQRSDSGLGDDDTESDTTSIASSFLRGHVENGRKYSSLRDDYWGPSDELQFESMDAGHYVYMLMEPEHDNGLFRAPIKSPNYVLDIGTGTGIWAIDVADRFPDATVYGVDLYPPPNTWVPPNCHLEVEDVIDGEWTWKNPFDLVHLRLMLGAFTPDNWDKLYRTIYDNLRPGGWIEQCELDVYVTSDDGTLPPNSQLATWGPTFAGCSERSGRPLSTQSTMFSSIAAAGFVNVQDDLFRTPLGPWARDPRMKEAGRINRHYWSSGLDGWAMWLLTRYGTPEPWSADEVRVYVAKCRQELQQKGWHIYHLSRRVWAQKPVE